MSKHTLVAFLVLGLILAGCGTASQPAAPTSAPTASVAQPTATTATAPAAEPTKPTASGAKTIKIGVLNPTTGSFAYFGKEVNAGIELLFSSLGNKVAGANIELVFADTAGEPQQALEQARRLVGQEKVDFLMGIVNAAVVVPVAQFADQEKVPLIVTIGGARVITGPSRSPYVFRNAMCSGQQERPLGWYVATKMGLKRAATLAWDFSAGEERTAGFVATYTKSGGSIVTQQKPPFGVTDYGPYLSQINPNDIDVAYSFFSGPGAIAFLQQLRQFGLTPKIQIVAPDYMTSGVLPQMGDNALGLVQASQYAPSIDTPENKKFVELYKSKLNAVPGAYGHEGYLGAAIAARAIEAVGGDLKDKQKFLDSVARTNFTGPSGPFRFDDRGQAVRNIYITKVVKGPDGAPTQQILDVVENVGQEWTPQ